MRLYQTKVSAQQKKPQQQQKNEKATHFNERKCLQIISDKGFISKIHKESIQLNSTKTIQLKSGQCTWIIKKK